LAEEAAEDNEFQGSAGGGRRANLKES